MVVIPGLLAIVVNFIVLVAGQRSPQQAAIPSVLVGVVMAWWMNTRRIKRVNEFHEFHQAVENFGTPPAPRGGWANPTRGQKFNRWIDVTRKYRRRG